MKRTEVLYECPICGRRQWEPVDKFLPVFCTQPEFPHAWVKMYKTDEYRDVWLP